MENAGFESLHPCRGSPKAAHCSALAVPVLEKPQARRFPRQPADLVSTLLIARMGRAAPIQVKQLLQFHMIQNKSPLNTKYPALSEHCLVLSSATRVIY